MEAAPRSFVGVVETEQGLVACLGFFPWIGPVMQTSMPVTQACLEDARERHEILASFK